MELLVCYRQGGMNAMGFTAVGEGVRIQWGLPVRWVTEGQRERQEGERPREKKTDMLR